jgi:hypothetical protein
MSDCFERSTSGYAAIMRANYPTLQPMMPDRTYYSRSTPNGIPMRRLDRSGHGMAIARHKWIDRVRDASRFAALPLDDDVPIEDHGEAVVNATAVDNMLNRLKPAQAIAIRLVEWPKRRPRVMRH